jgi:hypothetical protein
MKKPSALASALRDSGATLAASALPQPAEQPPEPYRATASPATRRDTKPITVHYPPAVRQQLKILSGETGRTMEDLVAEGLNLLFARHRKPEIAPRKDRN